MFTKVSPREIRFATRIRFPLRLRLLQLVGIRDSVTYVRSLRTCLPPLFVGNRRSGVIARALTISLYEERVPRTRRGDANLRFRERRVGEHVTGA